MLTESEALATILAHSPRLSSQSVALHEALGAFAAGPVIARLPLPTFDNSAMDGYAVRAADTLSQRPLTVTGEQPAGNSRGLTVGAGLAVRIFTGAPMPVGADAVIMQEDVRLTEDGQGIICTEPVVPEENVRIVGCDLCAGQRILEQGDELTPQRLAVLASQGLTETEVTSPPRITIVTTGDELVPPGQPLAPGQIYNSNGLMLAAMVRSALRAEVSHVHVPDDLDQTVARLRDLADTEDFVLLSGGVSVGDHDYVRPALQSLGIEPIFWRVKIKPGKPLLFAQSERAGHRCTFFGLPGNPVSSFVTWQVFVRPSLLKAAGACPDRQRLTNVTATLTRAMENRGDRPHYVRGLHADGRFTPLGAQQSHALFGLSQCNALLRMEPNEQIAAGATRTALLV